MTAKTPGPEVVTSELNNLTENGSGGLRWKREGTGPIKVLSEPTYENFVHSLFQ